MDVGRRGVVWMFHPDGIVLFREPSDDRSARRVGGRESDFRRGETGQRTGTIEAAVRPGEPALLTRISLDGHAAAHRGGVARPRRGPHDCPPAVQGGDAAFFGVLTLMMAGTLVVLFRQMDQKAKAERALARTQQFEADRLRAANERLEKALQAGAGIPDDGVARAGDAADRHPRVGTDAGDGRAQGEKQAAAIQSIERNARAQTRLVEDLLDMSRVVGGTLRLEIRR